MEINQQVKKIVEGTALLENPSVYNREITSKITVKNERTIVIGGLIRDDTIDIEQKVPLLGDIPIVGGLFRSTSNSIDDSKLYVFVKANILRPEDGVMGLPELERISERNRAAFEDHEDKFQKHQDWPGIKPKPVDPVHVLDAE